MQQKLYRRARRLAEEEWPGYEDPSSGEHYFRERGLRVGHRANGDRRYEVTSPQVFREWALREAGWTQSSDPEEVRAMLEGARLIARLIERLEEIVGRHLPPEAGSPASGSGERL